MFNEHDWLGFPCCTQLNNVKTCRKHCRKATLGSRLMVLFRHYKIGKPSTDEGRVTDNCHFSVGMATIYWNNDRKVKIYLRTWRSYVIMRSINQASAFRELFLFKAISFNCWYDTNSISPWTVFTASLSVFFPLSSIMVVIRSSRRTKCPNNLPLQSFITF